MTTKQEPQPLIDGAAILSGFVRAIDQCRAEHPELGNDVCLVLLDELYWSYWRQFSFASYRAGEKGAGEDGKLGGTAHH